MLEAEPSEPFKPRLQTEFSGSGPGNRSKTAIGLEDSGGNIDPSVLDDAPWWFSAIAPFVRSHYRQQFHGWPLKTSMVVLERAGIPPIYRLGLGLRWRLIHPIEDDFTTEDFCTILADKELLR